PFRSYTPRRSLSVPAQRTSHFPFDMPFSVFARRARCPILPFDFAAASSLLLGIFSPCGTPRSLWSWPGRLIAPEIHFFAMSPSRWCGDRACALRRHRWRPLLGLRRAFAIGASHLLARLQDHLLNALLAHPFDDVFGDDELTSIEAGGGLAVDLGRDVVGDGAIRR